MIIALKCMFLLLAITYGTSNLVKILFGLTGHRVCISSFQIWAMAVGIVGFVLLHNFLKL